MMNMFMLSSCKLNFLVDIVIYSCKENTLRIKVLLVINSVIALFISLSRLNLKYHYIVVFKSNMI